MADGVPTLPAPPGGRRECRGVRPADPVRVRAAHVLEVQVQRLHQRPERRTRSPAPVRHRRDRLRRAGGGHAWHPAIAEGGVHDRPHRHRRGCDLGRRRRLPRQRRRLSADAPGRPGAHHSGTCSGRGAGTARQRQALGDRARPRVGVRAVRGPRGPWCGAVTARTRVHRSVPRTRCVQPPDHGQAPVAEHRPGAHRERHAAGRGRHPAGDRAVLRWLRHPVAGHLARPSYHQRARSGRYQAVAVLLPRHLHHPDRADRQLHR